MAYVPLDEGLKRLKGVGAMGLGERVMGGDLLENGDAEGLREPVSKTKTGRKHPEFIRDPIEATDQIRRNLGMDVYQFSAALGYSRSAYQHFAKTGYILRTAAMAAEALSRRMGKDPHGGNGTKMFFVTLTPGMLPKMQEVKGSRELELDGKRYYLVPK